VEPAGAESIMYFSNGNHQFIARVSESTTPTAAERVALRFAMEQARFFDAATGVAL
jgi:ABC-type sugar transport system ATPase subunit